MTAETRALVNKLRAECDRAATQVLRAEFRIDGPVTTADLRERGRVTVAQLRRRRAAAYRLPPLPDGRHDPVDPR